MVIGIREMSGEEVAALLERVGFGHLGCCSLAGQPYVVPMHFTWDAGNIYFFTSHGTKAELLAANPRVCFQAEEVFDEGHWQSVMIFGEVERLKKSEESDRALHLLARHNPTLTPALNKTRIGGWTRPGGDDLAVYRLRPANISGRKTKS